eukprot:TRINITY_DN12348_c0_g1_i1.p1 TRINITY_DN12348_c0_g1~~TRINITY_DN12348_c0_g1_i1.p1  ORF type:complete len:467 (-),score=37.07 TRINITY_DN12348_c0_g1_i1:320-1720(-)
MLHGAMGLEVGTFRCTSVLSVNLCILGAGVTNRRLPLQIVFGGVVGACLLLVFFAVSLLAAGMPPWMCLVVVGAASLPTTIAVVICAGVANARCLGPISRYVFGLNDYKRERVDLFLRALGERPEWSGLDVICVQECYSGLFWPGDYPERLIKGAQHLGFSHVVRASRWPTWPATFGLNSGLLILSRRQIVSFSSLEFAHSSEAFGVNRGALHAKLADGTHIITCHMSPSAGVVGSSSIVQILTPLVERLRERQVAELVSFMNKIAPVASEERVVVAGDFNMDILCPHPEFSRTGGPTGYRAATDVVRPVVGSYAEYVVALLADKCCLVEATSDIRGAKGNVAIAENEFSTMALCRTTFGYAGIDAHGHESGPVERFLTSYGDGILKCKCDDAIFFRGFRGLEVAEDALLIAPGDRPRENVTHISDHWAMRVVLTNVEADATGDGDDSKSVDLIAPAAARQRPRGG